MPPRKSNVSTTSNAAEDGAEGTPAKAVKEGVSIEELSLPRSMIARLSKGVLPANTSIQKEALLALHKSATVFVNFIASHANENAQASGKKTIAPPDVIAALKDNEYETFLPRLEAELKKYNDIQCDKRNTYRRKVKEDKKAAEPGQEGEAPKDGTDPLPTPINGINGHVEADGTDDADKPAKKLKGEGGQALPVDAETDGLNDGGDEDGESEHEADANEHEDDDDEEVGDEVEDDAEDDVQDETMEDAADDTLDRIGERDEALDEPDSD
ncbi:hypothetical protein B0A50_05823 [Salinomyces thailandicus]|uniref:DNA polymerase epsilon subunit D n=1 Tax=Salinomyces thailandicus TaxID=706561 RepID=A0A4U0TU73_9PEZI|nr:hypothetical protein B0A50_05823 [Salinomyces thailandica]